MIYEVKETDGDVHFFRLPETTAVVIRHSKEDVLSFSFGHDGLGLQAEIGSCQSIKVGSDAGTAITSFIKGAKR